MTSVYGCQLDKAVRRPYLQYTCPFVYLLLEIWFYLFTFLPFSVNELFHFLIVIKVDRKSAGDDGLTFPDFANPRVNRWDARHDVIALPSSVFAQSKSMFKEWNTSVPFKPIFYGTINK